MKARDGPGRPRGPGAAWDRGAVRTRPILTAAEMRAAEEELIGAGTPVETLMERAGLAAAEAIWRYAGPMPALILCGPGNNGGDGYVIARALRARGLDVRVAVSGAPASVAAQAASTSWNAETIPIANAEPAALMIDALFGTGLGRPLDQSLSRRLCDLAAAAQVRVAIDLPSGVATDDGRILSPVPDFDLTITFQTLKPAHCLQPAARHMGRIVVADIGIAAESCLNEIERPERALPGPDDHKYSRGLVAILAGGMPGASALAASAAARAGAGAVRLIGPTLHGLPHAIVQRPEDAETLLDDSRIGAVLIGPGLGAGKGSERLLDLALASGHPLVLDAGALTLVAGRGVGLLRECAHRPILTPHDGEFARLFPNTSGSKIERARAAAAESWSVVLYKGADTIVADRDGNAAIAPPAPAWLASAGTGDVLAGIVAARLAITGNPFRAACDGAWLHGRAAEAAGPGLIADDLLGHLSAL